MANSPTHIFISYARKDGRDLALRLQADLTSKEYDRDAWLDTAEIAGGASWSNAIEVAIDRATVVLALLSAGSYQSEICRAEQLRSLREGKRVIPLLVQPDAERPLYLEHLNYRDFSTADYPAALQTLLSDIDGGQTVPLPEEFRATFNNAPPLPRTFVSRPAELERLRNAVIGDDAKRLAGTSQAAVTALRGMGGSGKSLLAAALCQDEVVQAAFPDGIFWVEIGSEARELVPRLAQIGERLGDDPARYTTPETAGDNLRNLLRDKAALFVLDDLWDAQHVTLFKANAPRCRILFTTRDGTIAKHHQAQEIQLGMLTPAQSRELLQTSAGYDDPNLATIADRLGYLPLALKLAGAQLQAGTTTTEWLETFHHVSQIKLGRRATDPHDNLQICFDLSVKQLAEDQDLYYALGIFAQDVAIPHQVMFRLWHQLAPTLTAADCRLLLTDLTNYALVEAKDAETVTLHDLLQDYCHAALGDQVAATHTALLDAYNPQKQAWPTIAHDGYLYHHLLYHLVEAGHQDEARQLLFDFRWLQAKLAATDANALVTDYRQLPDADSAVQRLGQDIQRAAHILAHDASQLAPQLLGRLLDEDAPDIQQLLVQAREMAPRPCLLPQTASLRESTALVRTFSGHKGKVEAVAVTPDGQRVVSASDDRTVQVWNLTTGEEERVLYAYTNFVKCVAITSDGQHIVSTSNDNAIKIWKLATGEEERILYGHTNWVNGVAVTPDGQRLISASSDNTLKVWNLATGKEEHTFNGHTNDVTSVAVIHNEQRIVSTSWDNTLKVWNLTTGKEERTFYGHMDLVWDVAVTPDDKHIVSASKDHTLKVWNLATGQEERTLHGHTDMVTSVAVTPDGQHIVSASSDHTLKVWNLATGKEEHTLHGHSGMLTSVAVTPDGQHIVSASGDHTVKVWNLTTNEEKRALHGHTKWVQDVAVTLDGQHLVSASGDHTIKVWSLTSGDEERTLHGHTNVVTSVAMTPNGRSIVSASGDHTIKVWNLASGTLQRTFHGHTNWVNDVTVTRDGQRIVSGDDDLTIKIWNSANGEVQRTLHGNMTNVLSVAVTPDGRYIVSGSYGGQLLQIWCLATGKVERSLKGHHAGVYDVMITPDGLNIVSASDDRTVRIWKLITDASENTIVSNSTATNEVAMNMDSQNIVSITHHPMRNIWKRAIEDEAERILQGHKERVTSVAMISDGKIVTASWDNTVKVWNLMTSECLATFVADSALNSCATTPDGHTVVAAGASGRIHFLRFEED